MATDQEIRDAGILYMPQQKYLQNPYNLPIAPVPPTTPPGGGGITNTNAFTNNGGNFNPAGNAFGYGEPVSEVNVRTFNPQSNDPTGAVADAQQKYNETKTNNYFGVFGDSPMGQRQQKYKNNLNNIIQDNRQNYGAQGQYNSPYDDSIDQGSTKNFTDDEETKKGFFSNLRTRAKNLGSNLPDWARTAGKTAAASLFVPQALPVMGLQALLKKFGGGSGSGPGNGTYGIAGLSDDKKAAYNALSRIKGGGLFNGQNGFKTLTGKNFQAKNYVPNQLEKYNDFAGQGYAIDDDGNITQNGKTVNFKNRSFLKNQIIESFAIGKQGIINQKKRSDAFKVSKTRNDPVTGTIAIQNRINQEYANQMKEDGRDFSVSGPDTSSNATGKSNQASSERGYQMHGGGDGGDDGGDNDPGSQNDNSPGSQGPGGSDEMGSFARGGRAGYFFGGRVNYKQGGRTGYFLGGNIEGGYSESRNDSGGKQTTTSYSDNDDGGASDNPPVTVVNNNPVDVSTVTKSVGDYEIPYGVEALIANKGRLQAVLNADNVLDKNLGAEFTYDNGPFSIGAYADMDGDKSLNANYTRNNSNYSFDLNDDGGQLKYSKTFANGGLASIL